MLRRNVQPFYRTAKTGSLMSVELIGVPILVMIFLLALKRRRQTSEQSTEPRERQRTPETKQVLKATQTRDCPSCGLTMEEGYLIGPRGIYWNKNPPLEGFATRAIGFAGEPMGLFSFMPGPNRTQYFKAYRCPRCSLVLMENTSQPFGI